MFVGVIGEFRVFQLLVQCLRLLPPASGGGSGLRLEERALILPLEGSMKMYAHEAVVWQMVSCVILRSRLCWGGLCMQRGGVCEIWVRVWWGR